MKKLFFILTVMIFSNIFSQKKTENLNFEKTENNLPKGWEIIGEGKAQVSIDSVIKKEGSAALKIESGDSNGFKGISLALPENYEGKEIKLSGYIKTENVTDGFASLWMRIDPKIAFDNMQNTDLKGTTDWKKYEITLKMSPEETTKIVFGALLAGSGTIWVDDMKITVDGKDIENAKIFEKKLVKADLDKEFDGGSKISNIDLDKNNTENLKNLGLIWGYLKYYHPNIAKGNYNWDYELFRILPKINKKTKAENDRIFISWIKSLGNYPISKNKDADEKNIKIKPDLEWISNSGFSDELRGLLLNLKNAERPKTNYYVGFFEGVNNPDFKNEKTYENMPYPDEGFRLLSLYRYWNIIQYYFPYKNLIEEDWKKVLPEFIPKFLKAENTSEYTLATLEIIARIHDTHANVWGNNKYVNQFFGERYPPVKITFAESKAVVKEYFKEDLGKESGLQKGDIILEVNGLTVDEIIKKQLKYTAASNYPTQLREVARNLLCSNDENIKVKFLRDGTVKNTTVKTYKYSEIDDGEEEKKREFFRMLDKNIAYFYMGSVDSKELPAVFDKMINTKGLVIDFRSYPSDFVVYKLGKLLKPDASDFVKFTFTANSQPGLFIYTPIIKVEGSGKDAYKGKIAILINETTQSSAEFHTMAFRTAPNAKVFGSTTAGADGNVSRITLPGNISTMISGIGVYYPDGKETQRIGIIPDVEVKPTIEGIKNERDEVLEKAVNWINN
ncbi:hypothetical protein ASG01_08075 [Chryseobacterium sp. Leaf180]|uniref:S41 family peptidase n=1 Tax=Chryseobacterium sp. Leaf180 TaxID=1736289 RepID=UPI0006F7BA4B|nr:S41 family peptidase [Chryseobacterium sp. Leaf180]KQR93810.1 hypothetical protein ASG01_08075 [Chryseobacterium sp. Leaf180]